jgi:transmembrane sensor
VASFSLIDRTASNEILTAPGEHRTVPLADGSKIIMNGGTRVLLDDEDPRKVELANGEALFEVRHDDSHPFLVTVGGTRLLDAGTVFNVVSEGDELDVAVAEGAVIYQPGRKEIRLGAGDALWRANSQAAPVLRKAIPRMVGGWQTGKLEYSDVTLDQVARDLSRNLGEKIRPAAGAERLRFSGTLVISGQADVVLGRAAPLLGVNFAADGEAWRMTPAHGAPPF